MNKSEIRARLFTIDFTLVSLTGLLVRLAMFMKMTLQPLYLINLFSSKTVAGSAMTVFTVAALILRPFAGRYIDRFGRIPVFIAAAVLFTATTIPFGIIKNLYILYLFQILCGIGFSFLSVASTTMLTDIIPQERLAEGLGYFGVTSTLAQAFGPALALMLIETLTYGYSFLFTGAAVIIAIVLVFFIRYEKEQSFKSFSSSKTTSIPDIEKKIIFYRLIERKAVFSSLFMGIVAFAGVSFSTFLVPFAQLVKIDNIGLFFTAQAIGVAISRLFAGKLSGRVSKYKLLITGLLIITASTIAVNFVHHIDTLMPIAFIYGIGTGLCSLMLNVGAVIKTSHHERAAANATFYLALDAGIGIGSLLWGVYSDLIGLDRIFIGAAFISVFTFLTFIISSRGRQIF